jgi:hypothetical protein
LHCEIQPPTGKTNYESGHRDGVRFGHRRIQRSRRNCAPSEIVGGTPASRLPINPPCGLVARIWKRRSGKFLPAELFPTQGIVVPGKRKPSSGNAGKGLFYLNQALDDEELE